MSGPAARRRWRLARRRAGVGRQPVPRVAAAADAAPPSVRRFSQRARRRRLRAAAPWAAVAVAGVVAGGGWWAVENTALCAVRSVRVTGVSLVTAPEVREVSGVAAGVPLARVDLAAVRRRVSVLPPVDAVDVERDWPWTLRVQVRERTPVAVVPRGGRYLWLDDEGVVFHAGASPGVPVVRLADPGPQDRPTQAALQVLSAMPPALAQRVAELNVASPARIRLSMRDGRTVVWGDAGDGDRKARTALALLRLRHRTVDVSAIDVVSVHP
ncbi:MAG TPA: FtsQ-type POTRA domain-containing protein [Pilimelia sp.]|nr:FtsQ-type POTRA domain-containing protein [Pilimelia sp.]